MPSIRTFNTLLTSLIVQFRVVRALILREVMTRYGRHNIGFAWIFAENLLFTSAVVTFWLATHGSNIKGLSIISFSVLGYSMVLLWRNCVNRVIKAVEPNKSLLYHRQVRIMDIYIARIFLELIASTGSFMFVYFLLLVFGLLEWPKHPHFLVGGWISLMAVAGSIALVVGPWSEISELLDRVWHILTYMLFPLSGAFIAVDWIPIAGQQFLFWIPLVHCAELIRFGYYGETYKAYYSITYLFVFVSIAMCSGMLLIRQVENRVVME
jgi:capsular polysaccharide transport system permease protein